MLYNIYIYLKIKYNNLFGINIFNYDEPRIIKYNDKLLNNNDYHNYFE